MKRCPCAYLGHHSGKCRCTPDQVARYRSRISGPILDRLDLHVDVPALAEAELFNVKRGESSSVVCARVIQAHEIQLIRQKMPNARLAGAQLECHAGLNGHTRRLMREAAARLSLSARAQHRLLKVARTIADLDRSVGVTSDHVAEAIQYRANRR